MKDELSTIKKNSYSKILFDVQLVEISSVAIHKKKSTISDAILAKQYTKGRMSSKNKSNEYSEKYLFLRI